MLYRIKLKWQKADKPDPAHREGQQPPPQQPPFGPPQQQMSMNWSHFKPKVSGKPEEDVEAHLL